MTRYRQMIIGGSSGDPGALSAQGTAADPIVFTSNEASPAVGDWYYIRFNNTSADAATVMDHCVVEYAGYNQGAIYLYNASPKIRNTTVRFSKNAGIYALGAGSATAEIMCNTFSNNKKGIYWTVSPPPEMHQNNFSGNSEHGLYYSGAATLNAEDNWWDDTAGPNAGGDAAYGNVDADPWSTAENSCSGAEPNQPPDVPSNPFPADGAVRVQTSNGVDLSWTGGDPNILDTLTYDLYWGTAADALQLEAAALVQTAYTKDPVDSGNTFYWQVVAKDDQGAQTTGPVWHFTTDGDPPDLVISDLAVDPAGNLQAGQSVTFTATVQNSGSGPAVDAFSVDFSVDTLSIGTSPVSQILLAGQSVQLSQTWTYAGGDPVIQVAADNQSQVSETDEANNSLTVNFLTLADNSPPTLVGTLPVDGAHLQQVQQISVTLADSQGTVEDAAVMAGFAVTDSSQQSVPGSTTESNDTFTFVPDNLPLADSTYQVGFIAADSHGNSQNYSFSFTIDTVPPAKPVITGGTVDSGIIQVRPVQNRASQFIVELTGTREAGTSVWVNGVQQVAVGDDPWSIQILLQPTNNAIEVWLSDSAGNQGESEWVDIAMQSANTTNYNYDASGRTKRIFNSE